MNYYVYETTNLVNGKKYIGKRSCKCPIEDDTYIGSGTLLKKAVIKYGKENFKKEVLQVCNDEEEAFAWEDFYTMQVNAWNNPNYYNLRRGGIGGSAYMSEETRELISNNSKRMWEDENYKRKMVSILRANGQTEEFKSKVSRASQLKWQDKEYREKIISARKEIWKNEEYRNKMIQIRRQIGATEEFKNKVSIAAKNNWANEEYRKKHKESMEKLKQNEEWRKKCYDSRPRGENHYNYGGVGYWKGKQLPESVKAKISKANSGEKNYMYGKPAINRKKVILLNSGKIFNSLKEASNYVGLSSNSTVCNCCKGRKKSAGKINGEPAKWMYYEDYLKLQEAEI